MPQPVGRTFAAPARRCHAIASHTDAPETAATFSYLTHSDLIPLLPNEPLDHPANFAARSIRAEAGKGRGAGNVSARDIWSYLSTTGGGARQAALTLAAPVTEQYGGLQYEMTTYSWWECVEISFYVGRHDFMDVAFPLFKKVSVASLLPFRRILMLISDSSICDFHTRPWKLSHSSRGRFLSLAKKVRPWHKFC